MESSNAIKFLRNGIFTTQSMTIAEQKKATESFQH